MNKHRFVLGTIAGLALSLILVVAMVLPAATALTGSKSGPDSYEILMISRQFTPQPGSPQARCSWGYSRAE